jgi:hypothetical protein
MGRSSVVGHEIVGETTDAARVDAVGVEHPLLFRPVGVTDEQGRKVAILGAPARAIGKSLEQGSKLGDHLLVQLGDALAKLWPPHRGDPDLGKEEHSLAVGTELEQQEVEGTGERTLGVEHVQLGQQRCAQILDHLIDGREEEVFLGVEVVVNQAGRDLGLLGDALYGRLGEPVLDDGGTQTVDDLPPARLREARPSHKVD